MAKKFKYDIYSLIEVVESKECLWDKTKEVSKDKVLRKNAWRDVCTFLEPNFEDLEKNNKDEISKYMVIYLSIFIKMNVCLYVFYRIVNYGRILMLFF